jgi:tetratricopeptide (TPR) repeat protein
VVEEPGKIIPRRRHARAGLLGIGGAGAEQPGGAPSWIWFAVAAGALVIAVIAAVGITTQKPPFVISGATAEQSHYADSLSKVLGRDSLDLAANVGLGNVLYDSGHFDEAVRYYRRALAVHPDLPDVRVDMAVSLHQSGHTPEAIAELQQVIAAHPEHGIARLDLGIILESVGRLADAEAAYRAMANMPLPAELRSALAERTAGLQEKKRAMAQLPTGPPGAAGRPAPPPGAAPQAGAPRPAGR